MAFQVNPQFSLPADSPGSSQEQPAEGSGLVDKLKQYLAVAGKNLMTEPGTAAGTALKNILNTAVPDDMVNKGSAATGAVEDWVKQRLTGKGKQTLGQNYDSELANADNEDAKNNSQHPLAAIAGNVVADAPAVATGANALEEGAAPLLDKLGNKLGNKVGSYMVKNPIKNALAAVPNVGVNAVQGGLNSSSPAQGAEEGAVVGGSNPVESSGISSILNHPYISAAASELLPSDVGVPIEKILGSLGAGVGSYILNDSKGFSKDTPDIAQKRAAVNPRNLNESEPNTTPGEPVSPHVPNVITEPDGTKSLITATGQKIPLG